MGLFNFFKHQTVNSTVESNTECRVCFATQSHNLQTRWQSRLGDRMFKKGY